MSLLQLGVPIPLCADYIRMKALSSYTGWLIDCDNFGFAHLPLAWMGRVTVMYSDLWRQGIRHFEKVLYLLGEGGL